MYNFLATSIYISGFVSKFTKVSLLLNYGKEESSIC